MDISIALCIQYLCSPALTRLAVAVMVGQRELNCVLLSSVPVSHSLFSVSQPVTYDKGSQNGLQVSHFIGQQQDISLTFYWRTEPLFFPHASDWKPPNQHSASPYCLGAATQSVRWRYVMMSLLCEYWADRVVCQLACWGEERARAQWLALPSKHPLSAGRESQASTWSSWGIWKGTRANTFWFIAIFMRLLDMR